MQVVKPVNVQHLRCAHHRTCQRQCQVVHLFGLVEVGLHKVKASQDLQSKSITRRCMDVVSHLLNLSQLTGKNHKQKNHGNETPQPHDRRRMRRSHNSPRPLIQVPRRHHLATLAQVTVNIVSPPWLEPRWKSHHG